MKSQTAFKSPLISSKTSTRFRAKTQETPHNVLHPQNTHFIYQNNYMANSIKFIFKKEQNPTLATLKKSHQRSNTLNHLPSKSKKLHLESISSLLTNTGAINNNLTRQSTFYNKRSISTITHAELVKDIAFKNMNSGGPTGNELRCKFNLDQKQIDELISAKKRFFIKAVPARHQTPDNMSIKSLQKCKQIMGQKKFENDRKIEHFDSFSETSERKPEGRIFALTHLHINKKWAETVEPLPQIPVQQSPVKKKKEKRIMKHSIKVIRRSEQKINHQNDGNFMENLEASSAREKKRLPSIQDLLANLDEKNFPQYNKELGPNNKFLNLENLNKPKKQKEHLTDVIKRRSIIGNEMARQSILMNMKISSVLSRTNDRRISEIGSDVSDNSSEEEKNNKAKSTKKLTNKTKRGVELRRHLREALMYLASLKLDLKELQNRKIFSNKPYEKTGSFDLITAVKHNDQDKVFELLVYNKYLVYDFDYVYLTALHWAAKRGEFEIAKILIKFGSDLNAKDLIGRTPLYLAMQHNKLELMQLLLYHQSSPWSTQLCDYKSMVCKNPLALKILTRARQLDILIKMTPPRLRRQIWLKDSWTILMNNNGKDDALLRRILA